MAKQKEPSVTLEQANAAMLALTKGVQQDAEEVVAPEPEQPEAEVPQEASPAEGPEPEQTEPTEEPEAPADDDVASLRARLGTYEEERKHDREQYEARLKAFQERSAANEQILRKRMLQKATAADRALKTLKAARTESGVAEADVDRVIRDIESTMNPESSTYVPPEPDSAFREDHAMTLNAFLNEKGMTLDEANGFGQWIQSDGRTALSDREQAVAQQSLDGFLRIAHSRWQSAVQQKATQTTRSDAVGAVRSVQRTQREAARAASVPAAAPRKQPATKRPDIDLKSLKHDDVSALLRNAVNEAKRGE